MRAVIDAAHRRQKLAVVHIGDLASARDAIAAGADGLVHLFADSAPTADLIALAKQHKTFVIPTLTVVMSITGTPGAASLLMDSRLTRHVARQDGMIMAQAFPKRPGAPSLDYTHAQRTVRALHEAGIPILAGTDAGNPGTAHGVALHRELELLVQSGMTPAVALASASSVPAKAFGMKDRGIIAEGLRADLLLVDGDPTSNITATRAIAGVWKQGTRFDRDTHAKTIAAARDAVSKAPVGSASGLVSNFDGGDAKSSFGAGWMISDDAMAGGASSASMKVVTGGATGSSHALQATGTVDGKVPHAWAGVMYSPGAQVFQPANLTDKKEIRFWAKGDGETYRLMLFVESKGYVPLSQNFVAGTEWTEHVFSFASYGIDGKGLMAVIFAAGPAPGPFSILLDEVRFK
jgi:hypothetical protein